MEKSRIAANYLRYINNKLRGANDNETVYRRGLLYRFIACFDGDTLPIEQLLSDNDLKTQYPWVWVDGIWRQRWDTASAQIATLVQTEQGCSGLLGRLPLYKQNTEKRVLYSAMIQWYANMKATDKTRMDKCLDFLGLPKITNH
ncbi:MAG: hypothetical protein LBD59_03250 [Prevotellaceae bacterium]|jgi:hypothetical protein|nr:hypothetical protein [Prevotellaceae bacterium]